MRKLLIVLVVTFSSLLTGCNQDVDEIAAMDYIAVENEDGELIVVPASIEEIDVKEIKVEDIKNKDIKVKGITFKGL